MKNNLILFFILSPLAFFAGYFQKPTEFQRAPTSLHSTPAPVVSAVKPLHAVEGQTPLVMASVNKYENLPCPSEENVKRLASQAHITASDLPISCDDPYVGKILKLLYLAENLKIYTPSNWGGSHQDVYASLFHYITKMIPLLEIDTHIQNKIATNYLNTRITLGSLFFELPPLAGLEVLIHEGRHSSLDDPGHVRCRTGEIPKTLDGCDEEFSIKKDAGAYSFGFMYHLGLGRYGEGLSSEDRDFSIISAIAGITGRFNKVPETLAVPLDMLFVLKENNELYQVHPFTHELIPVDVRDQLQGQNIKKIQYSPLDQGILIFTDLGRVFALNAKKRPTDYYSQLIPSDFFVVDSNKIYISAGPSGQYAYSLFLNKDGDIYLKDVDAQTGKPLFVQYKNRPPEMTKKMFMGSEYNAYLLSESGKIYQIVSGIRGGAGKDLTQASSYRPYTSFTKNGIFWKDASGGATYDGLMAVGSDGKLYFEKFLDNGGQPVQRSDFIVDQKLSRYQEGLNIKVGLSDSGRLYVWDYARKRPAPWSLPVEGVKDFALARSYAPADFLLPIAQASLEASQACLTNPTYRDPWTQGLMGLKDDGELVFSGTPSSCTPMAGNWDFVPESLSLGGSELYEMFSYFSQTYLELKDEDQQKAKIHPYFILAPAKDKLTYPPY